MLPTDHMFVHKLYDDDDFVAFAKRLISNQPKWVLNPNLLVDRPRNNHSVKAPGFAKLFLYKF